MTLTQLEYIVAVGDCKSFAKASEKCFITQPTLSMQIKKLEQELNVLLFDRSKKPVRPTEIGNQIIEQARISLSEINRIHNIITSREDDCSGELRLGVIPTLSPYLLPLFIVQFGEKYPNVVLTINEMLSEEIAKNLYNDTIDVGLLVTPFEKPEIVSTTLFYEEFVAYIAASHPLHQKSQIEFADFDLNEMWLLKEGHCFRNQVVNICGEQPIPNDQSKLRFESSSLETLRRLVESQSGYTMLPELATQEFTEEQKKLVKEFPNPKPKREVSMVMHQRLVKRKLVEAFKQSILDYIPPHLQRKSDGQVVSW